MELDYVGIILWTAGLTLFLLGLSWGGGREAIPLEVCSGHLHANSIPRILTNRLTDTVTDTVGKAAVEAGMPASDIGTLVAAVKSGAWSQLDFLTDDITVAIAGAIPTAYSAAFTTVYLASLAFGGVAVLGNLCTMEAKKLLTNKVERRMHGKGIGGELKKYPEAKTVEEV